MKFEASTVMMVMVMVVMVMAGCVAEATSISYSSLTADSTPCDVSGSSYADCSTTSSSNLYTTSCTVYTTCNHIST